MDDAHADWPGDRAAFAHALLAWARRHGRRLAFRASRDPYQVMVAEAMAQQTQVARVEAAHAGFVARFPDLAGLARASTADVLRAWRGLGYNRRALNLQRAARIILERHAGRVPPDLSALEALPGVGPYTSRAIAVHAFGLPAAPLDTNVRRVLSRLLGRASAGDRQPPGDLQSLADALVPAGRAAHWSDALMDLGATVCTTRPHCAACPLRLWCRSADRVAPPPRRSRSRPPGQPFRATSRWLRGRILDLARDASGEGWQSFHERIGDHRPAAVRGMLAVLAAEGLLERHPVLPRVARLPR